MPWGEQYNQLLLEHQLLESGYGMEINCSKYFMNHEPLRVPYLVWMIQILVKNCFVFFFPRKVVNGDIAFVPGTARSFVTSARIEFTMVKNIHIMILPGKKSHELVDTIDVPTTILAVMNYG